MGSKTLSLLSCLIVFCGLAKVGADGVDEIATAYSVSKTNAWVDEMLKTLLEDLKTSVGPVTLPSQNVEFNVLVLWEDVKGGLNLTDGLITNVFNIHRVGDAALEASGDKIHLKLKLGVEDLGASYAISFSFAHLHDAGTVTVLIESLAIGLEVRQNFAETQGSNNVINMNLDLNVKVFLGKIGVSVESHVRSLMPSLVKKNLGHVLAKLSNGAEVAYRAFNEAKQA